MALKPKTYKVTTYDPPVTWYCYSQRWLPQYRVGNLRPVTVYKSTDASVWHGSSLESCICGKRDSANNLFLTSKEEAVGYALQQAQNVIEMARKQIDNAKSPIAFVQTL